MILVLENHILRLEIQEPGAGYNGSRFDWTGQIIQIIFANKQYFCTDETPDPSKRHLFGRGLYNEFGIDMPIGYQDCPPGEQFPKIGIGYLLKESDQKYDFFKNYRIEPFDFSITEEQDSVTFICRAKEYRDYAFILVKKVTLSDNTFTIRYVLENRGERDINTNEYVHNFLAINGSSINNLYRLKFSFPLRQEGFGESLNPKNIVDIYKKEITWKGVPDSPFFFSHVNSGQLSRASWFLEHEQYKVGISESCEFPVQKINIWGTTHVVSPEIFYYIALKPGEKTLWERKYCVYKL
ncbi:hypothetical protein JXQ31_20165 [candidate division KSB1 bacterium]|nr:hypothetical protein [candidate division KSB1 bacterium]